MRGATDKPVARQELRLKQFNFDLTRAQRDAQRSNDRLEEERKAKEDAKNLPKEFREASENIDELCSRKRMSGTN